MNSNPLLTHLKRFAHPTLLSLALLTFAAPCAFSSSLAGYQFGGAVTFVYDPFNLTNGLVDIGTTVTGEFRYDTNSPNTCTPEVSCYVDTTHINTFSPPGSFFIQLNTPAGPLSFANDPTINPLYVMVSDGSGPDAFPQQFEVDGVTSANTAPAGLGDPMISLLLYSDAPHRFLSRHDLTTSINFSQTADAYSDDSFQGFSGIYYGGPDGPYQIQFRLDHITGFQPTSLSSGDSAPEPGSLGYLGLGLVLIAAGRRIRAKRSPDPRR